MMENLSISSELPRVRRACYVVALGGIIVTGISFAILAVAVLMDRGLPYFVYELAIGLVATIYFGSVTKQAVRAAMLSTDEHELPQTLHYLSRSVIGLLIPVVMFVAAVMWFLLRSPY